MAIWSLLAGLLSIAAFLYVFVGVIYRLFISPLKRIPGPILNAITSIPHDLACMGGSRHEYLEDMHNRYGPIVRIAPTEVSFIDGSIWRDVFSFGKHDAECARSDNQERMNGATGILDAERIDHRRVRRLLSHAFSDQSLRAQEHRLQSQVDTLVNGLQLQAGKGPVDATQWIQWTTFDIMGDLAFGESFKSLEAKQTHPWQQFLLDHIAAAVFGGIAQRWGLGGLATILTPPSLMKAVKKFHELSSELIMKRLQQGSNRGDFLDHILKYHLVTDDTKSGSKGLGLEELKNTASDIAIAGSETTATVLSGLVFQLLVNPDVLDKVAAEIRTIKADEDITVASTLALPYFNAVLEESLRVLSPSPIPSARTIPPNGMAVGGYWLPGGTRVFAAHHIAYRSTRHFAKPKEFIPERWLPGRAREFEEDNADDIFHPFAVGPRSCIGSHLAKAEMRLIMAKLLWHFDLKKPVLTVEEESSWDGWFDRLRMYFLWHKPPLMVLFRERAPAY